MLLNSLQVNIPLDSGELFVEKSLDSARQRDLNSGKKSKACAQDCDNLLLG